MVEAALTYTMSRILDENFGKGNLFLVIPYRLRNSYLPAGLIVEVIARRTDEVSVLVLKEMSFIQLRVLCKWKTTETGNVHRGWIPAYFLSPAPPRLPTSGQVFIFTNFTDILLDRMQCGVLEPLQRT